MLQMGVNAVISSYSFPNLLILKTKIKKSPLSFANR